MVVAEEINEAETRPYVEKLVTEAIFEGILELITVEEISDSQKGGGAVGPFLASTKLCLAMYAFHAAFVAGVGSKPYQAVVTRDPSGLNPGHCSLRVLK